MQTDRAAMLDEILDYVKFLRLQVKVCFFKCSVIFNIISNIEHPMSFIYLIWKIVLNFQVLSMSRLGGAGAVAQLVADIPLSVKVTLRKI